MSVLCLFVLVCLSGVYLNAYLRCRRGRRVPGGLPVGGLPLCRHCAVLIDSNANNSRSPPPSLSSLSVPE